MSTVPTQYAYRRDTNERVEPGTLVESFRGETWTFDGVSRLANGNSTGRVAVSAACGDGITPCAHMWHRDGIERAEYYPSVFDLYLGDAKGVEA